MKVEGLPTKASHRFPRACYRFHRCAFFEESCERVPYSPLIQQKPTKSNPLSHFSPRYVERFSELRLSISILKFCTFSSPQEWRLALGRRGAAQGHLAEIARVLKDVGFLLLAPRILPVGQPQFRGSLQEPCQAEVGVLFPDLADGLVQSGRPQRRAGFEDGVECGIPFALTVLFRNLKLAAQSTSFLDTYSVAASRWISDGRRSGRLGNGR